MHEPRSELPRRLVIDKKSTLADRTSLCVEGLEKTTCEGRLTHDTVNFGLGEVIMEESEF